MASPSYGSGVGSGEGDGDGAKEGEGGTGEGDGTARTGGEGEGEGKAASPGWEGAVPQEDVKTAAAASTAASGPSICSFTALPHFLRNNQ